MNHTALVSKQTRPNETIEYIISGVPQGAKYEISVQTDAKNSIAANISANAVPLPVPQLMSVRFEKNGSYIVTWKDIKGFHEKYVFTFGCLSFRKKLNNCNLSILDSRIKLSFGMKLEMIMIQNQLQ